MIEHKFKEYYFPHHDHAKYSIRDGVSSIKDKFKAADKRGFNKICCTDHGNVNSIYDCFKEAEKYDNIKAGIGCELYFTPSHEEQGRSPSHITTWVLNDQGWEDMLKLQFLSNCKKEEEYEIEGFKGYFHVKPSVNEKMLFHFCKDNIAVGSGCRLSYTNKLLMNIDRKQEGLNYLTFLKDNIKHFFIELHIANSEVEERLFFDLKRFAKQNNLYTLIANDSHYVDEGDLKIWNILSSNRDNKSKEYKPIRNDDFYMKTYDQIYQDVLRCNLLDQLGEEDYKTLSNDDNFRFNLNQQEKITKIINHEEYICNVFNPLNFRLLQQESADLFEGSKVLNDLMIFDWYGSWEKRKLPSIEIENAEKLLKARLMKGFIKKFGNKKSIPESYISRIKKELEISNETNNISYFYLVSLFLDACVERGLMLSEGRGSAASLLICHLIGAARVDPMMYNFKIERAMNTDRPKLMDIDLDFSTSEGKIAEGILREVFGKTKCINISTYGSMGVKQALQTVCRYLRVNHEQVNIISKRLSIYEKYDEVGNLVRSKANDEQMLEILFNMEEINNSYILGTDIETFKYYITSVMGTLNNVGVHPAGMLICNDDVWKHVPVIRVNDVLCCAYDMDILEKLNGLKLDILKIASNDLIRYGLVKKFQYENKDIDKILFEGV